MSVINVQISSIDQIDNQILDGELSDEGFYFDLKPEKDEGLFKIRWTFQFNIENGRHIIHRSRTVFTVKGLDLDYLTKNDPRLDLLTQLGQISMAHSRVMFLELNKDLTNFIPLMLWRHELSDGIIQKINSLSN